MNVCLSSIPVRLCIFSTKEITNVCTCNDNLLPSVVLIALQKELTAR